MTEIVRSMFAGFSITDVIDVAIVAFVVYKLLEFIRETRAEQLVKGLLFLVVATFLSDIFYLYTINWLLKGTLTIGVIALIIIFQPELRRALEYIGRSKIIKKQFREMNKEKAKSLTSSLIKVIDSFSISKTGALIIIERETNLTDIAETGTPIDAVITESLLDSIFYPGTALHDGACIIRNDRILAAGCVLPLTGNKGLSRELGTRHRAGIGITEHSDAIGIIVSEETGIISIAIDGKLSRFLDIKTVEKTLLNLYLSQLSDEDTKSFVSKLFKKRGRDDEEGQ